MLEQINNQLDRFAQGSFGPRGKSPSAFRVWGGIALLSAMLVTLSFTVRPGLSPAMMLLIIAINLVAAFALGMVVKIAKGTERHTHYHYEIAIALLTVFTLRSFGQPVLPYLDVMVIGKGVLLAIGRLGCLMAGCCHGRPAPVGVRYTRAQAGCAHHYIGVRLFPVQLLESLIALFLTGLCGCSLVRGAQPGTTLATYVIGYGAARFFAEFLRGDPQRPWFRGHSEAQWTSLLLMSVIMSLEYSSVLPFHRSHAIVAAGVWLAVLAVTVTRSVWQTAHKLLHPRHVAEVAKAFELVTQTGSQEIFRACTSQGVQVSAGQLKTPSTHIDHYSLSRRGRELTERTARTLLRLVPRTSPNLVRSIRFVAGNRGVFHLLIYRRTIDL